MNDKELQKKLSKILVLTDLLVEEIDHPVQKPNKTTKQIQSKYKTKRGNCKRFYCLL